MSSSSRLTARRCHRAAAGRRSGNRAARCRWPRRSAVRRPDPIMSAPTPSRWQLRRCAPAASASSPTTTSAACRAAAPGQEPMPGLGDRLRNRSPGNSIRWSRDTLNHARLGHTADWPARRPALAVRMLRNARRPRAPAPCQVRPSAPSRRIGDASPCRRSTWSRAMLLDQSQMRADHRCRRRPHDHPDRWTARFPVDIDGARRARAPRPCRLRSSRRPQTFGPDVEEFHKTTFQYSA